MGKAVLIAALGLVMMGQAEDEGVVTSTDLVAPDVSASERDGQAEPQRPERVAPRREQEAPVSQDRETADKEAAPPKKDKAASDDAAEAPREVTSEEARRHKAVAAFWFILPET
ncbi:MAG: hypothetical protein R6V12_08010 [Candidatus Hydrogenedentota bacterium]